MNNSARCIAPRPFLIPVVSNPMKYNMKILNFLFSLVFEYLSMPILKAV